MTTAYFDCASGISGDMTLGALIDAGADLTALNEAIGSLGLDGVRFRTETVRKRGFRATQLTVDYQPESTHRHLSHILKMIEQSGLTDGQKTRAEALFRRLAQAEAKVHGTTVEKVHFHEVGAADSIADLVGVTVALDLLGIKRIVASAVPTGTGSIQIAHGRCRVPAPATAELLCGIPIEASEIEAELTTPTGAVILAELAERFGPMPSMLIRKIGYGAGQRDLESQANLLRVLIGEEVIGEEIIGEEIEPACPALTSQAGDQIWVVETNLDDTTGEMIGHCLARLWEQSVLDVYTTPVQMKKNRPAVKLTVLCKADRLDAVEQVLFDETTTLGVRRWPVWRETLPRMAWKVETAWGKVLGKVSRTAGGRVRFAPEFEACRQLATEKGISLQEVYRGALESFDPAQVDWNS